MAEMIVYDNYIADLKRYFKSVSLETQDKVSKTIETMNRVCSNAVMSGQTAEAMKDYTDKLNELDGTISKYGARCIALMDEFITELDEIDKHLY